MTRVVMTSRVGPDGVLHLDVPFGSPDAGREVQVTVEAVSPVRQLTPEEWAAFLADTAGAWQGEFERPSQGELERREALS